LSRTYDEHGEWCRNIVTTAIDWLKPA